jgi:hypothetical protein
MASYKVFLTNGKTLLLDADRVQDPTEALRCYVFRRGEKSEVVARFTANQVAGYALTEALLREGK